MAQLGGGPGFALKTRHKLRVVGIARQEHLESGGAVEGNVAGKIHRAHPALTQAVAHVVGAEFLAQN
jgi:hypothetical protein